MSQSLVASPAHFDRGSAVAVIAPMAFVAIEPLAGAAVVAHKKVGRLFLMSRMNGHNFLFGILVVGGRMVGDLFLIRATSHSLWRGRRMM